MKKILLDHKYDLMNHYQNTKNLKVDHLNQVSKRTWQNGMNFPEGQDKSEISLVIQEMCMVKHAILQILKGMLHVEYWKKTVGEEPLRGS